MSALKNAVTRNPEYSFSRIFSQDAENVNILRGLTPQKANKMRQLEKSHKYRIQDSLSRQEIYGYFAALAHCDSLAAFFWLFSLVV